MWIRLLYGGPGAKFNAVELKKHMQKNNLKCIVLGAEECTLAQHKKPESLDYWLRNHKNTRYEDTMQAVTKVIGQLVNTGMFYETQCTCPTTGKHCNGLALRDA